MPRLRTDLIWEWMFLGKSTNPFVSVLPFHQRRAVFQVAVESSGQHFLSREAKNVFLWTMRNDTLNFFSEVSRMQSPFRKNPAILSRDWMHRDGCNLLPPISTTKFKVGTGGQESRKKEYLASIQVTSIQVQDCLLGWFPILVLFSRLVRHYLLAVYSLCLSLQ